MVEESLSLKFKQLGNENKEVARSVFFVGMKDEDRLFFEKGKDYRRIENYNQSLGEEVKFQNIPELKERLLTALHKAQYCIKDGDTCSVSTRILGKPFWKLPADSYKCSELANHVPDWNCSEKILKEIEGKYKPSPDKTTSQFALDIKVSNTEETLSYRKYQISQENCGETVDSNRDVDKDYSIINVGHGYFLYPSKKSTYLYIIDPHKNLLTLVMINVQSCADPDYKSFVMKHEETLKAILQQDKSEKISLPLGYSIAKQYRCHKLVLELSEGREICIKERKQNRQKFYHDKPDRRIHFVDQSLNSKMNEEQWKEEEVAAMIEKTLMKMDHHLTFD